MYEDEDEWETFCNNLKKEDCEKIFAANLNAGYDSKDVADKMDYVERLPYNRKKSLIQDVKTKLIPKL